LTIDFAAEAQEGALERKAWVERATRSLVFAQGELRRPNGTLAASASAVFRRAGD
jgi:acyl-coenzyme A thioesterase PaaI-like protein